MIFPSIIFHSRALLPVCCLTLSSQLYAGNVNTEGEDLIINTKSGFALSTIDQQFSFELGGKIQWDLTAFDGLQAASQNQSFDNTLNSFIRRGELSLEGVAYKDWGYGVRLAYDDGMGSDNSTEVDRSFIYYTGLGLADIHIGKFGVNYGLENTTSSAWITAIERPFMYDFLNGADDAKFGIMLTHTGKNYGLMAQVGHYDAYESADNGNNENFGYTLRANWAPYLENNNLVHVGANFHNHHPDDSRSRIRTRLGIRSDNDDRLTFGDVEKANNDTEWLIESGAQFGGLRFQAEYFQRHVSGEDSAGSDATVDVQGYYGQFSYLFNGARNYKSETGKWDKPEHTGATEIFARYERSTIKADENAIPDQLNNNIDGILAANTSDNFTASSLILGINYFPIKNVRISLNYVDYQIDNIDSSETINGDNIQDQGNAIISRLQFTF